MEHNSLEVRNTRALDAHPDLELGKGRSVQPVVYKKALCVFFLEIIVSGLEAAAMAMENQNVFFGREFLLGPVQDCLDILRVVELERMGFGSRTFCMELRKVGVLVQLEAKDLSRLPVLAGETLTGNTIFVKGQDTDLFTRSLRQRCQLVLDFFPNDFHGVVHVASDMCIDDNSVVGKIVFRIVSFVAGNDSDGGEGQKK